MSNSSRRDFLAASAGTVGTLSALTATGASNGPNERIRIAVMGLNGRGKGLLRTFSGMNDVQVAYLCDVDDRVIPEARRSLSANHQGAPVVQKDIRRILEDRNVDAIVVATPDHWHALATVWACQAGKHVYVEKPVSHNIVEGRRMVEAARRHNRIVQAGTQRRSTSYLRSAAELVRDGRLGKIPFVRTWIAGNRPSIGRRQNGQVPQGVDYDLWLGPAIQREFNPNRFHYNWHWFWEYGTGELGNNGIHALDVVRGVMNLDAPLRVQSGGGKHFYEDDQETPDTQIATYDFEHTTVVWEHRIWSRTGIGRDSWGVIFYGQRGTLIFNNNGWTIVDGIEGSDTVARNSNMERDHVRNFLDCIKNNQRPNADIEQGHLSTRLCHLGNIAFRTRKTLTFDSRNENFGTDAQANQLLSRTYRRPFVLPERA